MISEKTIKELDGILRRDYGKKLSEEELFASALISYFQLAKIYFGNH